MYLQAPLRLCALLILATSCSTPQACEPSYAVSVVLSAFHYGSGAATVIYSSTCARSADPYWIFPLPMRTGTMDTFSVSHCAFGRS